MRGRTLLILAAIIILAAIAFGVRMKLPEQKIQPVTEKKVIQVAAPATTTPAAQPFTPPINQFKQRVTKKFFGTFVTPGNSPVSPERFTGFHTGVDVEYADVTDNVPVFAIADGMVVTSEYALGYGGVIVIKHEASGRTLFAIYGHLRPESLVKTGRAVTRGEKIGVLGTGYSRETDGERRHLHFGVANSNTILGYVSSKAALLATWIDPLSLF